MRSSKSQQKSTAMRIAQIAPLIESVPPRLYGGTERVVSYLTEELVRQGHEGTLFASGDSQTSARLVPVVPRALRLDPNVSDASPYQVMMLGEVRRLAHAFDILISTSTTSTFRCSRTWRRIP